ncbi:hypothetical protein ACWKTG_29575 [Bacillus thuringiensis]
MNLKMQFRLLLEKLFQEYEECYPRMYFVFQKVEQQFVFTDVNQELLQSVHQQREEVTTQLPHGGFFNLLVRYVLFV